MPQTELLDVYERKSERDQFVKTPFLYQETKSTGQP